MTSIICKLFIKNYKDINNFRVRESYGILASIVGILCNLLLFFIKISVGFLINSVSIMADAFNNLSDTGSALISFIGFKMANKPADNEHPFGHGRIEYISALIVSFIILLLGYEFLKNSFGKILAPEEVSFNVVTLVLLIFSVFVKVWLSVFNKNIGNKISSPVLIATSKDSLNDCIITSVTIFSALITYFTNIVIDGYAGVIVAIMILYNGFTIAKETLSYLLGESLDPALATTIKNAVEKYDGIMGSHDLIVHNYGPNRSMASIHAEVPDNIPIKISHEIIDTAEREISKELGIILVIHMDPIAVNDERIEGVRTAVLSLLEEYNTLHSEENDKKEEKNSLIEKFSAHDFRIIDLKEQTDILFDLIVPHNYLENEREKLIERIQASVKMLNEKYNCVINVESGFILCP